MSVVNSWRSYLRLSATFSHSAQAFFFYTLLFVFFFVALTGFFTFLVSENLDRKNTFSYLLSGATISMPIFKAKKLSYYLPDGRKLSFSPDQRRAIPVLRKSVEKVKINLIYSLLFSLFLTTVLVYFFGKLFLRLTEKSETTKFIRGGLFVPAPLLKNYLIKNELDSDFYIGDLPCVRGKESRHFLMTGDTGVGKSQQIMAMLDVVALRKKKAIIWDKSGELIQHFYNPERGDKILSPFDDRSENWSPFFEAEEFFEFERLAFSFIPLTGDEDESKKHWPESAITVFSWLLYKLHVLHGVATPDQIFQQLIGKEKVVLTNGDGKEYEVERKKFLSLLEGTPAELVVDTDAPEHAGSVVGTLAPKIRALWYLRGLENRPPFSLKKWAENEDNNGWVFIRAEDDQLKSIKPLVTAWIDTVISAVLSLPKSQEREIWAVVDELQSLEKLGSLKQGLFEGRKHGLRLILGFTSLSELNAIYGKDSTNAIISMCGTKLIFRVTEEETARRAAKLLLEEEVISERKSFSIGANENLSANDQKEQNLLVSPSEIMLLEDMVSYVRFPGNLPTTKVEIPYTARPTINPPSVVRQLPDPINYSENVRPSRDETVGVTNAVDPLI